MEVSDSLPKEIEASCSAFEASLDGIMKEVTKLTELSQEEVKKLPPLEQAKLDLLSLYTMNSMAWVYNTVNGVDPKQTALKDELQRVQVSMKKAQENHDEDFHFEHRRPFRIYACPKCELEFKNAFLLGKHMKECDFDPDEPTKKIEDLNTLEKDVSKATLLKHLHSPFNGHIYDVACFTSADPELRKIGEEARAAKQRMMLEESAAENKTLDEKKERKLAKENTETGKLRKEERELKKKEREAQKEQKRLQKQAMKDAKKAEKEAAKEAKRIAREELKAQNKLLKSQGPMLQCQHLPTPIILQGTLLDVAQTNGNGESKSCSEKTENFVETMNDSIPSIDIDDVCSEVIIESDEVEEENITTAEETSLETFSEAEQSVAEAQREEEQEVILQEVIPSTHAPGIASTQIQAHQLVPVSAVTQQTLETAYTLVYLQNTPVIFPNHQAIVQHCPILPRADHKILPKPSSANGQPSGLGSEAGSNNLIMSSHVKNPAKIQPFPTAPQTMTIPSIEDQERASPPTCKMDEEADEMLRILANDWPSLKQN
ncbi:Oidioi.mRNA.OKI2018_I69.XSR.g16676.t1.cds [Oikopleura dioica]|uniref:Nuclear nucleic acid-binding protein C1D n=1 Tax=Oikopleura dioica TaxID=34765 RepID=A0ABN7SKT9_OIKDI|nr:Oidioi.mRNA.OKI2018_I69.XSR.g16676.t1.cds [Oikopleura dioica]